MKQKAISNIPVRALAALIAMVMCCWGCSSESDEPRDGSNGMAILSIRISLTDAVSSFSASEMQDTRVGEEYESDKLPANDFEKMHTVRIIIVNSQGVVEHNTLWNLNASPDIVATGEEFPVSSRDTKKIILVANEENATVTLPDGSVTALSDYFKRFSSSVGSIINLEELKTITHAIADNNSYAEYDSCLHGPLAMSAIHQYYIGDAERYSATFSIHRAAVKYTYRITNLDKVSHTVNYIKVNNIASRQFLFPDADFTDDSQYFLTAYRTPSNAGASEVTLPVDCKIEAGKEVELGPFYFPEGTVTNETNPYRTAFAFDGVFSGWRTLEWAIPQQPDQLTPMTDLPRNTHVIVNVKFKYGEFDIDYTVCPWNIPDNIEIPPFN